MGCPWRPRFGRRSPARAPRRSTGCCAPCGGGARGRPGAWRRPASTAGRYCATLVAVDVATSWTELQALYDLHHQRVTGAIQHIHERVPVPLREWHSACYELLVKPVNSLMPAPLDGPIE